MTQRGLLIEIAKFRNDAKGLTFKERLILDRLIKELGKRELSAGRLNKLEELYNGMVEEYQKIQSKQRG